MPKHITIETTINRPVEKVWEYMNDPKHVPGWVFASDDWEAPHAESDFREGGKFLTRMSAKDKSEGFDFTGTYTKIVPLEKVEYTIDDGRVVSISFEKIDDNTTRVTETFEMENINSEELQRAGWQAILDNLKKYAEGK